MRANRNKRILTQKGGVRRFFGDISAEAVWVSKGMARLDAGLVLHGVMFFKVRP